MTHNSHKNKTRVHFHTPLRTKSHSERKNRGIERERETERIIPVRIKEIERTHVGN